MKTLQGITLSGLALCAGLLMQTSAHAVALNPAIAPASFADTVLPGTTVAARPELAGVVLEDVITPFAFNGVSGTVQNRVVRETTSGTLDFAWKINVDASETGEGIIAFRLGNFGLADLTDADWRIDGLGSVAPTTARLFSEAAAPGGGVNFLFDNAVNAGQSSNFFFVHTGATHYAQTALFDQLCGPSSCISGTTATFAPSAVPEPGSLAMALAGLAMIGVVARRR